MDRDHAQERYLPSSLGIRKRSDEFLKTAKHLEPLKGGKIPVEILSAPPKDAAQKSKFFERCLDLIKKSGVGTNLLQWSHDL